MLDTPSTPLEAGVGAVLVAAFFLILGWLIADALFARRGLDGLACWGLAFFGVSLYALAMMLLHMATGGSILEDPVLTRGITGATFLALFVIKLRSLLRTRSPGRRRRDATVLGVSAGILVITGLSIWGIPVLRVLPLGYGGDIAPHAAWASQLLNGETTPSGPLSGEIPNYYPWLWHALSALIARFTPGGHILHALAPLQVLQVVGVLLGLFSLGRLLTGKVLGGGACALLGGLTGGVGFVLLRKVDVVMDPRVDTLRYAGDLLARRSYNAAFSQLAPPFPRDVALTLLISSLLLLISGLKVKDTRLLAGAGSAIGLTGLAGAESFFLGVGVAVAMTLIPTGMNRVTAFGHVLVPMCVVYGVWAVPQVISYIRLDGFVNLTVVGPVELPPTAILVSWGIMTPLAIYGSIRHMGRARHEIEARAALIVTVLAASLLFASVVVPILFGEAFTSLGRPHRYWPLVYVGLALFATLGAGELLREVGGTRMLRAVALGALIIALALPSPTVASLALARASNTPEVVVAPLRGERESLLSLVAPGRGGRCVVAAPLELALAVWSYSGYRLVMLSSFNPRARNRARIRWHGIYEQITPEVTRLRDNPVLVGGVAPPDRWNRLVKRYGVDIIVTPDAKADAGVFGPYPHLPAADVPYTVVRLTPCGL